VRASGRYQQASGVGSQLNFEESPLPWASHTEVDDEIPDGPVNHVDQLPSGLRRKLKVQTAQDPCGGTSPVELSGLEVAEKVVVPREDLREGATRILN
jgi:hypothetical protein